MELNIQDLRPLTQDNLDEVFQLYEENEEFFKISKTDIKNQTLGDKSFNPELSLVYYPSNSEKPIAVLVGVVKKGYIKKNLIVKMCSNYSGKCFFGSLFWMCSSVFSLGFIIFS